MRHTKFAAAAVVLVLAVVAAAPAAGAWHFAAEGWQHQHYKYPPVPSGYSQIVSVFGQPCNSNSTYNRTNWVATDNGTSYAVYYHYKLGGWGTHYGGKGRYDMSSNLNQDVRGHLRNDHLTGLIKSGIWGYACRYISGTTKWSTHAWGIAVDINSAYEHYGADHKHCHSIPGSVSDRWKAHSWKHGWTFGDCMHFQYAINY
ncbi:MAG TPA: M15 family metallopeptidase [Actinomycetota bacterium]|jgi:hypothetical protein|nr:M15 family metallopeptidase [Actinomycetota bacterium]